MGYLIFLVLFPLMIYVAFVVFSLEDWDDRILFTFLFLITLFLMMIGIAFYSCSDYVANPIIRDYEAGNYQKEVIVSQQDTIFKRWVHK